MWATDVLPYDECLSYREEQRAPHLDMVGLAVVTAMAAQSFSKEMNPERIPCYLMNRVQ